MPPAENALPELQQQIEQKYDEMRDLWEQLPNVSGADKENLFLSIKRHASILKELYSKLESL
jgi:hypothetical protein